MIVYDRKPIGTCGLLVVPLSLDTVDTGKVSVT